MASGPGITDAEVDVAAYKMSQLTKSKDKAEQDLQQTLTRMTVIDSTLDVINQKAELEKKGIWKKINDIPEEQLEAQIEALAIDRKESQINLTSIVEAFDVDRQTVKSQRSADFNRSRDEIMKRKAEKN